MPRYVVGITLKPQERVQQGRSHDAGNRDPCSTASNTSAPSSHTCSVTLPDGTACPVTYARYSRRAHQFRYEAPVHQRLWFSQHLPGGLLAIEEKAQALCIQAFTLAQAAEQKDMQRKSPPKGVDRNAPGEPELRVKTADECAGKYAVCLKFGSGRLTPVGLMFSHPQEAQRDLGSERNQHIQLFGQQKLVVGICCRYLRKWIEPQFLASPPVAGEETAPLSSSASQPSTRASKRVSEADETCEAVEDEGMDEETDEDGPWEENAFVEGA